MKPLDEQARPSADFSTLAPAMDSDASGNQQWDNKTEINIFAERQAAHFDSPHFPLLSMSYPGTYFSGLSFFTHNKYTF